MTRTCKACDGTGVEECPGMLACHRLALVRGEACTDHTCHACIGTGHIEERIPASDAIADAETLRATAYIVREPSRDGRSGSRAAYYVAEAIHWGEVAVCNIEGSWAGDRASEAARAAFRAVPGLRG